MNREKYFSKTDTAIFKGIAIMLIVLHNYLHWQTGFGIENEADFSAKNIQVFLNNLYPIRWTQTFTAIFAFLGHYGVQLFIFFSAYGLTVQMINKQNPFKYWDYLFKRLKKLYFLLFFGIILYQILYTLHFGEIYSIKKTVIKTILLGTSLSNFSHSTLYKMFVGPFWFFGLMVQLYIIFPFLYNYIKKISIYLFYVVIFALIYLLYYLDLKTDFSVFGTVFGHLPEVVLGIYFALNRITKPSSILFFLSIIIFVLSQYYWFIFPFSFVAITIILLYILYFIKSYLNPFWTNLLLYIGKISMILFITNGFFRAFSLFSIDDMTLRGERIFLYLILLFLVCHFINKLYIYLYKKLKI